MKPPCPVLPTARTVTILVEGGASVDAVDDRDRTALMFAAANGFPMCVRKLLDCGAAIDARAKNGYTAASFAAANGHLDALKELHAAGGASVLEHRSVDPRVYDLDRDDMSVEELHAQRQAALGEASSVLDVAREAGHDKVAKFIEEMIEAEHAAQRAMMADEAEVQALKQMMDDPRAERRRSSLLEKIGRGARRLSRSFYPTHQADSPRETTQD